MLYILLFVVVLSACNPNKEGDISDTLFTLESNFKDNYQLWVDMKTDGSIQYREYALDIKEVGLKFKTIGDTASLASYQKDLSEEDRLIYETYRQLGGRIYDLGHELYYGKKEEAKQIYAEILAAEESLKE